MVRYGFTVLPIKQNVYEQNHYYIEQAAGAYC